MSLFAGGPSALAAGIHVENTNVVEDITEEDELARVREKEVKPAHGKILEEKEKEARSHADIKVEQGERIHLKGDLKEREGEKKGEREKEGVEEGQLEADEEASEVEEEEEEEEEGGKEVDKDAKCNLRFLMVTGKSFNYRVPLSTTVGDLKKMILQDKPKEVIESLHKISSTSLHSSTTSPSATTTPSSTSPSSPTGTMDERHYQFPTRKDELRILHFGRFLDDHETLSDNHFSAGQDVVTTVHLNIRAPPSMFNEVKGKLHKKKACCCIIQ